jgi:hypothetical protein
MIQVDEFIAQQFVMDFESGASYQLLMSKYNLSHREVEILVERFFPPTLSQEVTLIDWKSQARDDSPRRKGRSATLTKETSNSFLQTRIPYGKKGVRDWFRKLMGK